MNPISNIKNEKIFLDTDRIPLATKPKWYQKESTARIQAVAFMALAAIGVAATCALLIAGLSTGAFPLTIVIGGAAASLLGSVAFLALGIHFKKKPCWQDPSFIDKASLKAQDMTFSEIYRQYGHSACSKGHLISKKFLSEKFFKEVETAGLNYKQALAKLDESVFFSKLIDILVLKPLLKSEIEKDHLTLTQFKEKYGYQPIKDGLIPLDDPWYLSAASLGMKGKSYADIKKDYSLEMSNGTITQEMIKKEIKAQYDEVKPNVKAFIESQGGVSAFLSLIDEKIIEAQGYREDFLSQEASTPVSTLITSYGWNLFTHHFVSANDFKEHFLNEERDTSLSELLRKFGGHTSGWNVLHYGFIDKNALREKALTEIKGHKMSFEDIETKFGWNVFANEILSGEMDEVRYAFAYFIKEMPFSQVHDKYYGKIVKYQLLDTKTIALLQKLSREKTDIDSKYKLNLEANSMEKEAAIKKAQDEQVVYVENLKQAVQGVTAEIETENTTFNTKMQRQELAFETLQQALKDQEALKKAEIFKLNESRNETLIQGRVVPGSGRDTHSSTELLAIQSKINALETRISAARTLIKEMKEQHEANLLALTRSLNELKNAISQYNERIILEPVLKSIHEMYDKKAQDLKAHFETSNENLSLRFQLHLSKH